ncbi:MAG: bifunctional riboflavin kinase/FAD synthetase [Lachnospiraceae bacterium]|nr:bifunctional riboflavin kinase/FAD synthetase [Lachnospiraceae bacterium]
MKLFQGTTDFLIREETALAIGKFDGLHRGHEYLLHALLQKKAEGLSAAIFTFETPPGNAGQKVLSTNREKCDLFERAGIDVTILCPFDETIRRMRPEAFLQMLREKANIRCVIAGKDCTFGYRKEGNAKVLQDLGEKLSFETRIVEKLQHEGRDISSTYIRETVSLGEMEKARNLLGYPYFVSGKVRHGNQIGRRIGIPTMNLIPEPEKLLPPNGVYVTNTVINEETFPGVSNVGVKPTVEGNAPVSVETHLFSFEGENYGEEIKTEFLSFLRPEKRFADLTALQEAMRADIEKAKCTCDFIAGHF